MPDETDALFEKVLASAQEEMDGAASDWKPEAGSYLCLLADVQTGTFEENDKNGNPTGRTCFFLRPVWSVLQHPTLAGTAFNGDMRTNRSMANRNILKTFVEKVTGQAMKSNVEAFRLLKSLAGRLVCTVIVKQRKEYLNDIVKEVHGAAETTPGTPTP